MTHIQGQKQTSSLHSPLCSWLLFWSIYKWVKIMNKWDSLLFPWNTMTGYISAKALICYWFHMSLAGFILLTLWEVVMHSNAQNKQTTNRLHPKLSCVWRPWHLFSLPRCKRGLTYRSSECVLVSWIISQFILSEVVLVLQCRKEYFALIVFWSKHLDAILTDCMWVVKRNALRKMWKNRRPEMPKRDTLSLMHPSISVMDKLPSSEICHLQLNAWKHQPWQNCHNR